MGTYCQICEEKGTQLHDVKRYEFTQEFDGIIFKISIAMHPECIQRTEYKILEFD